MPIYEYHCRGCGEQVEILVRSAESIPKCPHCGAVLTERLLSVPYVMRGDSGRPKSQTCCGREERCNKPPCSDDGACRH